MENIASILSILASILALLISSRQLLNQLFDFYEIKLYLDFEDKLNILATNYRQIYILASYSVIIMLYIYYLFWNLEIGNQITSKFIEQLNFFFNLVVMFSVFEFLIYIIMNIYAHMQIKKLLPLEDDFSYIEKSFKTPVCFLVMQGIVLFLPYFIFSSKWCPIIQLGVSLAIAVSAFFIKPKYIKSLETNSNDKYIDYKNCQNIKIYLKDKNMPLEFEKELKEDNFTMIINKDNNIHISNKKVTRIQNISSENIRAIEFIYLDRNRIIKYGSDTKSNFWEECKQKNK